MFTLKPLAKGAVQRSLVKAERYRLLNEPWEAESICLDVLDVEPDNQDAVVILLLALTDQFDKGTGVHEAKDALARLGDPYQKAYYAGIISERHAKAVLDHGGPGSQFVAYDWFREAMNFYEEAEKVRPAGNDDSILRWNACARLILHFQLQPGPREAAELPLE